ncbi:uncharacterized protein KY384_001488 [Bacidia gigantensis]|uniref:uncharacterized protein n=1 Tax=Bacidia gigantensis TaxID=2732470 RepID=UPI001D04C2E3|nr:uncharacterized protein KY384_001488 [Bacidia gigantensis]KAG8533747.1 hypothetical protein KY384_001488 [Bacidia gigantensis]
MPVIAPPPTKEDSKEGKLFSKHKWRGKLFSGENPFSKSPEEQDNPNDDVAQFLGYGGRRSEDLFVGKDGQHDTEFPSRRTASSPPPPRNIYHRAKPRQNKGLHVDFVIAAPEIIGLGGDEAETPASLVFSNRSDASDLLHRRPALPRKPIPSILEPASANNTPEPDDSVFQQEHTERRRSFRDSLRDIGDVHPSVLQPQTANQANGSPSISPIGSELEENHSTFPIHGYDPSVLPSPPDAEPLRLSSSPRASPEPHSLTYRSSSRSPDGRHAFQKPSPLLGARTSPSHVERQLSLHPDHVDTSAKPKSLRNAVQSLGADALDEFDTKVSRINQIFRLGVAVQQDPMILSLQRWIRVATWWFLKGRGELEAEVRSRSKDSSTQSDQSEIPIGLKQAYVDLAKAWWIVKEIAPSHPELRRYGNTSVKSLVPILENFGNQDLAKLARHHVDLQANIRALAMSMKRNGRLPPDHFELQKLDVRVLLEDPSLPSEAMRVFTSQDPSLSEDAMDPTMPLTDSANSFYFSRFFGAASVVSRRKAWEPFIVPSVVSLSRKKDTLDLTASISSQDESVNLMIQTEKDQSNRLIWSDVNWSSTGNFISVAITPEIDLSILLSAHDFRTLWSICDYTRKIQKDYQGRKGEEVAYEVKLVDFQCLQTEQHASSFPSDPIRYCKVRMFSKVKTHHDGSGRIHAGFRLMARTPPSMKTLSTVSQDYGDDMPTIFGFGRRDDRAKLSIRVPSSSVFVLTFRSWEDLDLFYNIFTQKQVLSNEKRSPALLLEGLNIVTNDSSKGNVTRHLRDCNWQQVKVITREHAGHPNSSIGKRSQASRLIAQCDDGILTECLAMSTGELQMCLSTHDCNEIQLLRPPHRDVAASLTDYSLTDNKVDSWREMLWAVGRYTVVRSYRFKSLPDLHTFEALVMGFDVLYEGVGSYFAISRRRKGVPIHKYWEADFVRMQVLKQDKTVQLALFFKNFSHGSCMNFVVRSTDFFEKLDKNDRNYLRIVDAKFALPKSQEDSTRDFVCLDFPEYPGEHDDIMIGFEDMNERDQFAAQLPAAASRASKMGTLKKASSTGVLQLHTKLTGAKVLPLDCPASELGEGDVIHLETPINPTGEAFEIANGQHFRTATATGSIPVGGRSGNMHSGTKYLGGHSDMLCGVLATKNEEWVRVLRVERTVLGGVMGNMEGWLGVRSLRTLGLRVQRQSENAGKLVEWLERLLDEGREGSRNVQKVVEKVHHASLQQGDVSWLEKQMPNGFGSVFAATMKTERLARRLPSRSHLFNHATSLGGVESLIEWRSMSDTTVDPRLVRFSVGIEAWEDLQLDLLNAFNALAEEE